MRKARKPVWQLAFLSCSAEIHGRHVKAKPIPINRYQAAIVWDRRGFPHDAIPPPFATL